jgi:homoserine dehydrogenase
VSTVTFSVHSPTRKYIRQSHAFTKLLAFVFCQQGTVGGGVYELLKKHASSNIIVKKICVRSLDKPRDFHVDSDCEFVTDPDAILKDSEIDCVVEVMGGTTVARTVVMEALAQKKPVITANKALLAMHLDQIVAAAGTTPIAMEAAVCGGIPIIHALQTCYAGDTIKSISGIMNGTTNYMLCKMETGADYSEVLKEAQDLGFAEADPTADVEGHDVRPNTLAITVCLLTSHSLTLLFFFRFVPKLRCWPSLPLGRQYQNHRFPARVFPSCNLLTLSLPVPSTQPSS